ncbi:MAG: GH3 auxin-responsive promoter family protein, partial [Desulfuromonadales bacterium]|nr:GH3 auxin-responsive promoter family protein [Desulfuromonadales bacterium]NIS41294.1 GH3 auxin-responsive promoter family protein [Desulfuromonadales bacterium]
WAYLLGDTVRFLSLDPPRLIVTGRTSYILSALGEHVIEEEVADAVSTAARAIGVDIIDYSVAARVTQEGRPGGRHEYLI